MIQDAPEILFSASNSLSLGCYVPGETHDCPDNKRSDSKIDEEQHRVSSLIEGLCRVVVGVDDIASEKGHDGDATAHEEGTDGSNNHEGEICLGGILKERPKTRGMIIGLMMLLSTSGKVPTTHQI